MQFTRNSSCRKIIGDYLASGVRGTGVTDHPVTETYFFSTPSPVFLPDDVFLVFDDHVQAYRWRRALHFIFGWRDYICLF